MRQPARLLSAALAFTLIFSTSLPAGPLSPPPGPVAPPPGPEPPIPINASTTPGNASALFRITQPGSYYLTGNITDSSAKHGIEIVASNVTLDLRGFEVRGVAGSLNGIRVEGTRSGITVTDGSVTNGAGSAFG